MTSFFIIASIFTIISKETFVILPLFVMVYSILIVVLSIYMGKVFELPFIIIEDNVNKLLHGLPTSTEESLRIKEFDKLQEFFIHAIQLKENEDRLKKQFSDIAASAAHDIASPINAIEMILAKIKKEGQLNEAAVSTLQMGLQNLRDISYKLIQKYRSINKESSNPGWKDDTNLPRYIVINKCINTVIQSKAIEWQSRQVDLHFSSEIANVWLFISPLELTRIVSNLINNAYESLMGQPGSIQVSTEIQDKIFVINIKDSGCGISESKLQNMSKGVSSKHEGVGVGIVSAMKYLDSVNGKLSFDSKVGFGTKVSISIPIPHQPEWLISRINYSNTSTFIILDNDFAIIKRWQSIFTKLNIPFYSFIDYDAFKKWHLKVHNNENHIFLIDYDLDTNELNGLEIIKTHQLANAYLVTNHAEEHWLQEEITKSPVCLIPKHQINYLFAQ